MTDPQPFHHAKPGINAQGFRTAVRDYTEKTVVEELAANSYDADASTVIVLLDSAHNCLYVIDDGVGFTDDSIKEVATLGGGDKRDAYSPQRRRHYLGSYGYGLKSSLNIAHRVDINSFSRAHCYRVVIDWGKLEEALGDTFPGYPVHRESRGGNGTGTIVKMVLKNPTSKLHLDDFSSVLSNLPSDEGNFNCYVGMVESLGQKRPESAADLKQLEKLAVKLHKQGRLSRAGESELTDIENCELEEFTDKEDKSVSAKFYFAGLEGSTVKPMKPGLRGIYVRIHGRLLKQNFTGRQYTYPISKWVKFESGLRVELTVDWLRDQITLSREGIRFSNAKLEADFKSLITRVVSRFIQPQLKLLERKRATVMDRQLKQRLEVARRRMTEPKGICISTIKTGFRFLPESDGELALILSQQAVMDRLNRQYILADYNDKASFDALIWDTGRREFLYTEFEPTLIEFLEHKEKDQIQLVVTWSRGKWRIGARKKGRGGHFELISGSPAKKGHYKLLEYASGNHKKARKDYLVLALEEVLQ